MCQVYFTREKTWPARKQMIHEATVCANCRGMGTEEIESKYVYKGSGLPKMVTVPCHYCHGTGHL